MKFKTIPGKASSAAIAGLLIGSMTIGATAATAQDYPPPPPQQPYNQQYNQQPYNQNQSGYQDQGSDQRDPRYQQQGGPPPPPPPPPPQGYDGTQLPPPPPGYRDDPAYRADPHQERRYEAYAEDWSQRYCVKSHDNTAAGAVIGGVFGALLGSGLSGRHDHGTGALVGGLAGAGAGAVVGSSSSHATSPGCPPGFVVRRDAPEFVFDGGPYYYAAPDWYRPWYFYEGRWLYRPYPYHNWYYRYYGYGRGYYGRGYRHGRY